MKWLLAVIFLFVASFPVNAAGPLLAVSAGPAASSSSRPFVPLHTYFMAATGCSDANAGTSPASPWCTPNHAVVCGDVIIAAAGTYSSTTPMSWGTVSSCPSSNDGVHGINGTGGIYFAVVLCGGVDLEACNVIATGDGQSTIDTSTSNWAMEGFKCAFGGTTSISRACFYPQTPGAGAIIHHLAFINDIAINTGEAFSLQECYFNGTTTVCSHNVPGEGGDYFAVVGSIAQNAAQAGICLGAIDLGSPAPFDSTTGTRMFAHGNFSFSNNTAGPCGIDTEGYLLDTWDAHGYNGQGVVSNNVGYNGNRMGFQWFWQCFNVSVPTIKVYNNTFYANLNNSNTGQYSALAEMSLDTGGSCTANSYPISIINNIAYSPYASTADGPNYAAQLGGTLWPNLTFGGAGNENVLLGSATSCVGSCNSGSPPYSIISFHGNPFGTNFIENPNLKNTGDLLSNHVGVPNCAGKVNVTQCMGWDASTQTITPNSVIDDLTAQCAHCAGKGYQKPSTACVSSGPLFNDYPPWLKGIVYLHWTGSAVEQRFDLVTLPCGL